MNRLDMEKQTRVISALVEGNSIRATVRMTGVAKGTVISLLERVGAACLGFQREVLTDLPCTKIQCDEIWSFCYAKSKNVPEEKKGEFGYGDVWTWTAICADTKLVPSWMIGNRDARTAKLFMEDLAGRLVNRVHLTTDGNKAYLEAVENAFGSDIDYGMLVKVYGTTEEKERKYSHSDCIGTIKQTINGKPESFSTSYVERQNLTMRMSMRRFTRLTNAFSKKIQNLEYAVALHFMYYNFCRIHQSLRVTPAMKAKVTDRVWEIKDILSMIDK